MRAKYWQARADGRLQCELCPHGCVIAPGRAGRCRVRGERGGALDALGYGCVSSAQVDPIEKKPLYHFHPGSMIFSIGGWGCNLRCVFCQNWTISQQFEARSARLSPAQVVERAAGLGSPSIAYTYNEPLVWFEFVADCARLARERGLLNVLVTNGFVRPAPAAELLPSIDALNIDIKSMDEAFYAEQCGGALQPVLDFARQAVRAGCHVEITNLLIPGLNDADAGLAALAEWVARELGEATPLHLSAYRPQYKLDVAATPLACLERAYALCRARLPYVYLGNVWSGGEGHDTRCRGCGATLVVRRGYETRVTGLDGRRCRACGAAADLVTAP